MGNPFDQFDAIAPAAPAEKSTGVNPFDQFDVSEAEPIAAVNLTPEAAPQQIEPAAAEPIVDPVAQDEIAPEVEGEQQPETGERQGKDYLPPFMFGIQKLFAKNDIGKLSPKQQQKWIDKEDAISAKRLEATRNAFVKANVPLTQWVEENSLISIKGANPDGALLKRMAKLRKENIDFMAKEHDEAKKRRENLDAIVAGKKTAAEYSAIKSAASGAIKSFSNSYGEKLPKFAGGVQASITGQEPKETAAYKAGEAFKKKNDELFHSDPARAHDTFQQVADGLGQAGSMVAGGAALRGAGAGAKTVKGAMLGLGVGQGGAAGLDDALKFKADQKTQIKSMYLNAGLGLTEAIPISRMFSRLDKSSGGQVSRILKNSGQQGLEEMLQETVQTIGANVVAKELAGYDEGRKIMAGVKDAATVGGIVGAILGGGMAAVTRAPNEDDAPFSTEAGPRSDVSTKNETMEPIKPIRAKTFKKANAYDAAGGKTKVKYAIVDADSLVTSHDDDMNENPLYPQALQPRDRSRASSQTQVADIAAKLNPEQMGETSDAGSGAPIISENGIVESGNGRSLALRRVYAEGGEKAAEYRKWLKSQRYPIRGIKKPVLVRIADPARPDAERVAFTRRANAATTADMSVTERGIADARSLTPADFNLATTGGADTLDNVPFVRAVLSKTTTEAERGKLVDANGRLSVDGKRRVEAAVASYAYEDPRIVSNLLETTDRTLRSIGDVMIGVAPQWAKLRADVESGQVDERVNIIPNIIEAAQIVTDARNSGATLDERTDLIKSDMFNADGTIDPVTQDVLKMFYDADSVKQRSDKLIADDLKYYAQEAGKVLSGPDIFGDRADDNPAQRILAKIMERRGDVKQTTKADDFEPAAAREAIFEPTSEGFGLDPQSERDIDAEVEKQERDPNTAEMFDKSENIEGLQRRLIKDLGLRSLSLSERGGKIDIGMIAAPKGELGGGKGSAAMEQISQYADKNDKIITLTTGQKDDGFGTTSATRLKRFYKRFGFVENKGRNKDFSLSGNMYRLPKEPEAEAPLFDKAPATDSKAFKKWFGDSKVVDERGEPLVVYHGTANDFDSFDGSRNGETTRGTSTQGFWLSDSPRTAGSYANFAAKDAKINTMNAEIDELASKAQAYENKPEIANKVWAEHDALVEKMEALDANSDGMDGQTIMPLYVAMKNPLVFDAKNENPDGIGGITPLIRKAKAEGRDGLIIKNFDDSIGLYDDMSTHYMVFEPTQIKSTMNKGTFDAEDPRILYDAGPSKSRAANPFDKFDALKDDGVPDGYPDGTKIVGGHAGVSLMKLPDSDSYVETMKESGLETLTTVVDGKTRSAIEFSLSDGVLEIDNIWDTEKFGSEAFNSYGPTYVRNVARALKKLFPEAKKITGLRVGGARHGGEHDRNAAYDGRAPRASVTLKDDAGKQPQKPTPKPPVKLPVKAAPVKTEVEAIKGLHEITADIAKRFGVIYKQGRMGNVPASVRGWYKPKTGAIRGRKSNMEDIKTFAHEVGHDFEFNNGPKLRLQMDRHAAELIPLDYEVGRADKRLAVTEGFGNYFRDYIINRAFVTKAAPEFTKAFETWMDKAHPGLRKDMQKFADAYQALQNATSTQKVKANITRKVSRNGISRLLYRNPRVNTNSKRQTIKNEAEDRLIDGYAPMKRLVADLLDLKSKNKGRPQDLKAIDDPFSLMRLSENSMTAAMAEAQFGVKGYNDAAPSGPSLQDGVREAMDGDVTDTKLGDFEGYLVSKRAVFEWDRYKKGELQNEPVLDSQQTHADNIREMEAQYPQFQSASKKIYTYQRNLLKKAFDAGHMTQKTYDEILQRKNYVPFKRDMSDMETFTHFTGGSNAAALGKNAAKHNIYKGSGRPIISPLQSIIEETVRISVNTQQTRITNALIDLAESAGRGSAKLAEIVPLNKATAERFNIVDAFQSRLDASDLNPDEKAGLTADLNTMLDGDEMATVFKMTEMNSNGETILYGMKDGKQIGLMINDPDYARTIMEAVGHASNQSSNAIIASLAMTARVFRAGITTHPVFAVKNVIRDQVGGWLQTDAKVIPFVDGYKGMMSYINRDMMYQAYVANFGTSAGIEQSTLQQKDMVRSVEEFAAEGLTVQKVANIRAFAKLTDASEVASRMGNYMKFYAKYKKKGYTDQEAAVDAAWEATRVIDFSMSGRDVKNVRRIIPFLGSQISGMTRSKQVFFPKGAIKNRKAYWEYLRTNDASKLSQKDIREIELQRSAWMKAVIVLGLPSLALMAMYGDDEDFQKFEDYERSKNWIFKLGDKWVFVPKPFELASGANALERAYEGFVLEDETAAKQWLKDTLAMFKPPTDNPLINTVYEQRANHQMFFGTPIVGMDIEGLPAPEQHNAYTSALAKSMGEHIGKVPGLSQSKMASPARIDHVLKNMGGTWGADALKIADMLATQRPATTAETAVVSRGFVKNPDSGAKETGKFFDLMADGGKWSAAKSHLANMLSDGDRKKAGRAMDYAGDEGGKVYAVVDRFKDLDIEFKKKTTMKKDDYTALKRQHPIRRAEESGKIFRKARKEIMGNEFEVKMTARERQQFSDELSSLYNAVNANALIHSDVKGYRQRDPVSESEKWARLNEINPEAAILLWDKTQDKKMTPEDEVAEKYQDLKKKTRQYIKILENQK